MSLRCFAKQLICMYRSPVAGKLSNNVVCLQRRYFVSTARVFSRNDESFDERRTLQFWSSKVNPHGKLVVKTPFNVTIRCINPLEHPAMDKAYVTLRTEAEDTDQKLLSKLRLLTECQIHLEDEKELRVDGIMRSQADENLHVPLECILKVPIFYDLHVVLTSDASVHIDSLESHTVEVETQKGDCTLSNIKSNWVQVHSGSGNITCEKVVQGNSEFVTHGDGSITTGRLQGQNVRLETADGDIEVKSSYSVMSEFMSINGNMKLGSCHGSVFADVKNGNITIESLDGNLSAEIDKGDLSAHFSRHEAVNIQIHEGDMHLKLPEYVSTGLQIHADSYQLDEQLKIQEVTKESNFCSGVMNWGEDSMISAKTGRGNIKVQAQDWLQTLNIDKLS